MVFGKKLDNAIQLYLAQVRLGQTVLVVGGGNDATLSHLLENEMVNHVIYLDISKELIQQAKNKWQQHPFFRQIVFVDANFFDWKNEQPIHHIVMPFFMDLFTDKQVRSLFEKAFVLLSPKGQLHVIDFNVNSSAKRGIRFIIKVLYQMFSLATGHKRTYTPNYQKLNTSLLVLHQKKQLNQYLIGASFTRPEIA